MIGAGGAAGALGRYWVSTLVYSILGKGFPWGTLAVNVLGSVAMGFLYVWLLERLAVSSDLRALLIIGFLGAFTTFSTFSIETLLLIEQGALVKAGLNMLVSVAACLFAVWAGVVIARAL